MFEDDLGYVIVSWRASKIVNMAFQGRGVVSLDFSWEIPGFIS